MNSMTDNSENRDDEHQDEEDGITININTPDSDEDTEEHEGRDSEETTEENEDILDEDGTVTLDHAEYPGTVRLVGTVHVSRQTRERVVDTIQEEEPEVVAIELDRGRLFEMFKRGADVVGGEAEEQDDGFGLRDIIRRQQESQLEGDEFLDPGEADMLPAVDEGIDLGSKVALIDMSVDQLKQNVKDNAYEDGSLDLEILNKSFSEVTDAVRNFVRSRSEMADTVQDEGMSGVIDQLENSSLDQVTQQMDPLRDIAPEIVEALIDERDQYMAGRLHWLRQNGHDVVGVMGRGHLQGVYEYLQNPSRLPEEYVVEPDFYEYQTIEIN